MKAVSFPPWLQLPIDHKLPPMPSSSPATTFLESLPLSFPAMHTLSPAKHSWNVKCYKIKIISWFIWRDSLLWSNSYRVDQRTWWPKIYWWIRKNNCFDSKKPSNSVKCHCFVTRGILSKIILETRKVDTGSSLHLMWEQSPFATKDFSL